MVDVNPIIYFDHAATTSPDKEVVSLYTDIISSHFANPASVHRLGVENARLLAKAKQEILTSLKMNNHEVIFTSGATEANNLALKGYMERYQSRGKHLIISAIEHPSILNTANKLKSLGYEVSIVPVSKEGKVSLEDIKSLIRKDTILVSIMLVNNETGIVQDIDRIAEYLKVFPQIYFHVDAVQGIGKTNINYNNIDLLTISMHKLGGLKGTGVLIKRKNIDLLPLLDGGGQENGLRSGTNDLANAMCDALIIKKSLINVKQNKDYMTNLVKPLYDYFLLHQDEVLINSTTDNPYIVNISLLHKKASVFAEFLSNNNIMVSTHSACSSKTDTASSTLLAMGRSEALAKNSIRLSFSISNTKEEIDHFINIFDVGLKRIRG